MPVDSKHPEFENRAKQWQRCRDSVNGTDAIVSRNTEYLPKLSGQDDDEYAAYQKRATFFGATDRTVQGLAGAIFRRPPDLKNYPKEEHIEDFSADGKSIADFSQMTTREVLVTGRVGALVDVTAKGDMRAYPSLYAAETIVNWRTEMKEGKQRLVMVVLKEKYNKAKEGDIFARETKTQYRVLSFDDAGYYKQEVYRQMNVGDGGKTATNVIDGGWVIDPDLTVEPKRGGRRLDFIPFVFINAANVGPKTEKPPMLNVAEVNLSHFRTSADLEHGAHFTALPTAWVAGFPADSELRIGSSMAWVTSETNARAGFLEYTGQGLGALVNLKRDKELLMAVLGARLLEEAPRAVEAADTVRLRQSGENSVLQSLALSVSAGLLQIIKWVAWWSLATDAQVEKIEFSLNTDFYSAKMDAQTLTALMGAWQGGGISQDTFLFNLKSGEILPPNRDIEDEKQLIALQGPIGGAPSGAPAPPANKQFRVEKDGEGRVTSVADE